jgi:hypothetical protein
MNVAHVAQARERANDDVLPLALAYVSDRQEDSRVRRPE